MRTTRATATATSRSLLLGLCVTLGGCFGLNRGAPLPEHYVLDADGAPGARAAEAPIAGSLETPLIGLRPLRLADYLTSPLIVVRRGAHRVAFSEFHRWGEDLSRGVGRTLARRMAARSGAHRVESAPWAPAAQPEYRVQIDVLRFEGVAPPELEAQVGEAHLLATWVILGSGGEAVLASGTTEVRSGGWAVGDFDELVGLLDVGLDTLVDDLVGALDRLETSARTPSPP